MTLTGIYYDANSVLTHNSERLLFVARLLKLPSRPQAAMLLPELETP